MLIGEREEILLQQSILPLYRGTRIMKNTSSFSKYKSRKSKPRLNFWSDRMGPKVIHTFTSQWLVSMRSHTAPAIPIKPVTSLYSEARQQVKERTCTAWFLTEDFKGLSNLSCKEKSNYQNYFSEQLFFSPFSSLFTHTQRIGFATVNTIFGVPFLLYLEKNFTLQTDLATEKSECTIFWCCQCNSSPAFSILESFMLITQTFFYAGWHPVSSLQTIKL